MDYPREPHRVVSQLALLVRQPAARGALCELVELLSALPECTRLDGSTARRGAGGLASARAALGVVAFVAPRIPARPWVGKTAARDPAVRLFARTLGARDLALGLGALLALRDHKAVRGWLEAGALADVGDTIATLAAFPKLPRRSRWLVLASTAGAAGLAALLAPYVDSDR